ncbi:hypothetical protein DL89DRAFT_278901 [Linderina pennispora]|uniref:ABC transporter domain-containing protein n=1 Tax=Linderina pennispora TaxID=61395 RepID=A0A1Y1W335_9FUNG|nr:uncharacterized protein DL89DRAFT_278901 [Linderina pennispora]ORX67564.1 hypothetical protein DL89DRAFT_278901 [Linderina pennispora]
MGATRSHGKSRGSRGGNGGGSRGRGAYYKALYGRRRSRSSEEPHAYMTGSADSGCATTPQQAAGSSDDLGRLLIRLDRQQYGAYKQFGRRTFQFDRFQLTFDQIQADPYATPSRIRQQFPSSLYSSQTRAIASSHYLSRHIYTTITHAQSRYSQKGGNGGGWKSAKGGDICIERPGQEVIERTSVVINSEYIEARMTGRTILGSMAHGMFLKTLPRIVDLSMLFSAVEAGDMHDFVACIEDQDALRGMLADAKLVAFVGNGGISNLPLDGPSVVKFQSPDDLQVSFTLPNRGQVEGMGIPHGITVITGGGFHGKSTLLQAIEHGVYNHIPGDGRELVVTEPCATKVKAEEGRFVGSVDIRPFINNLPFGKDTRDFSTLDASGSTSMAASIQEALEAGTTSLLLDEDTCATNFLIRDQRMQRLVAKDTARAELWSDKHISLLLVIGGCGDYLDVATIVLSMSKYQVHNVTAKARDIVSQMPVTVEAPVCRMALVPGFLKPPRTRARGVVALFPPNNPADAAPSPIPAGGISEIILDNPHGAGEEAEHGPELDLSGLDQLVSVSQTRCIAKAIDIISHAKDGLAKVVDLLDMVDSMSLDQISGRSAPAGDLARPRRIEVGLAINRTACCQIHYAKRGQNAASGGQQGS